MKPGTWDISAVATTTMQVSLRGGAGDIILSLSLLFLSTYGKGVVPLQDLEGDGRATACCKREHGSHFRTCVEACQPIPVSIVIPCFVLENKTKNSRPAYRTRSDFADYMFPHKLPLFPSQCSHHGSGLSHEALRNRSGHKMKTTTTSSSSPPPSLPSLASPSLSPPPSLPSLLSTTPTNLKPP